MRIDLRIDDHPVLRVRHHRQDAFAEARRVAGRLGGQVAGVARRAEIRDRRLQHRPRRRRGLRHLQPQRLGMVGGHDPGAARGGDDGDTRRRRPARLGEQRRGFQQRVEILDLDHAGTLEGGRPGQRAAGERAGMRGRRRRPRIATAELQRDDRLARLACRLAQQQQPPPVAQAFDRQGHAAAFRHGELVGRQVAHIEVGGIACRRHVADREAALGRLHQCIAQRAGLAGDGDAAGRRDQPCVFRHEGDAGLQHMVDDAEAIDPDQRQPGLAATVTQHRLLGDALRQPGFAIARGEGDDAAGALADAGLDRRHHLLARQGDQHAVRALRDVVQAGDARPAMQLLARVFRVHAPDRTGEIHQVGDGAAAEAGGLGRDADHRDAARRQQPPERRRIPQRFRSRPAGRMPVAALLQSPLPFPRCGAAFL